ncbi:hypothetical protein Leryth_006299 [Lithospermum erythrorhizon]|nr:hypothetical protein Leryth_006299 [Lithospermum erythrorhizon]
MKFSATSFSAFAKHPILDGKELMLMVENFVSEQLNLTKDVLMEIKRIPSYGPELQKEAHFVLDSAIRLCKVYYTPVNWDQYRKEEKNSGGSEETDHVNHVINVMKYTIEKLCQLGILAANDGGSLVSVLNLSWKGVVTLLQLGKGALAVKIDVAGILLTLNSLAKESLKCAAEIWSNPLKAVVSVEEAKRIFLPVKFFLINAVRIITQYPSQAFSVFKEITLTVIMISTFRISLSKHELLKPVSVALAETLEPTSVHLLNSVINSAQLRQDEKFKILDWLFGSENNETSGHMPVHENPQFFSLEEIFSVTVDSVDKSIQLLPGRFALFLNILKGASDLDDDIRLGMARKLGWLFGALVDESIYSSVMGIPGSSGSTQGKELVNQSLIYLILHSLKTFIIVVSSTQAWDEVESFLLENFFHPHYLCYEIVTELWCFVFRHADTEVVIDIIDKLCSLLICMADPVSVLTSSSALRRIARSISMLVTYGLPSVADQIFSSVLNNKRGQFMPSFYAALLMEGFPLDCLSEKMRNSAQKSLVADYFDFLEKFNNDFPKISASETFGTPVFCLSAALQHHQASLSDTDMKTLKFLVAVSRKYRICEDGTLKHSYRWLLIETLWIVSNMKHLYSSDGIEEVILELQTLFISKPYILDNQIFHCKPSLAFFMGGLGNMEFGDSEESARNTAIMELYHMLLRERHWALVHLAISAFGYFAARTSCNQLWRFLPQDAALSFDLERGNEADEDRFMSEMKAFLEKEMACLSMKPSPDQYEMLVTESLMLKEVVQKNLMSPEPGICDPMEIDGDKQANRKRKLPEEITRGVELLQSGLKVMGSGISHWKQIQLGSTDIQDKILTQFSHLEILIADMVSLACRSSHFSDSG